MQRVVLPALVALAAVLAPSAAFADEPPPLPPPTPAGQPAPATATAADDVQLRSGGLLRGRVTEILPGDHVTVVVGAETKRVPWAEIERVIVGSAPPPAPVPAEAPAPAAGPRVRVHVRSSRNVILYRRPAGTTSWVQACTSPCDAELPLGDSYRVTGIGVPASAPFTLEGAPGSVVEVAVDPASTGGMMGGGFLAATGATAGFVGFVLAVVGQAGATPRRDGTSSSGFRSVDDAEKVRNAGLVTMLVGGGMALAGLLVFASSAKTDVTQSSSSADHASAARPLDAFLRGPTWRTTPGTETAATATFPLSFQRSF